MPQTTANKLKDPAIPIDIVLGRLQGVTECGSGWSALCPSHDDNKPSLSVNKNEDGAVLLYCHKGCDTKDVLARIDLDWPDLFPRSARVVAVYDYRDEQGVLLQQVLRYKPKGFSQRQPDGKGGWIPTVNGVRRVLYRLPELKGRTTVYIAEGEKDADRLWEQGIPATCNPGGAGKWKDEYTKQLKWAGASRVVVFPDHDVQGEDHARDVARSCLRAGFEVKIVRLWHESPSEKHGEDISDWLDENTLDENTKEELTQAIKSAPLAQPADFAEPEPPPQQNTPTAAWPLYDGADTWEFPATESLVDGLLPLGGVTWVGGMPKRYKSLLMLYVCLAIASRQEEIADHFEIHSYPKILYVAREDGGSRLKERRDDILAAWEEEPKPGAIQFVIRPRLDLLNPAHVVWLRETCLREEIRLLVLDTWTALSPSADPLGAKDQAALADTIIRLCEDIGGQVVVVDHSRKNRQEGQAISSADIFGPPQKWAAAEHIVMLDMTTDGKRLEVFVEGKDIETNRFFLTVSPPESEEEKFTYVGTIQEFKEANRKTGQENREAILKALQRTPQGLTEAGIVEALKDDGLTVSPQTVRRHLSRLGKRVQKIGKRPVRYVVVRASAQVSAEQSERTREEDLI